MNRCTKIDRTPEHSDWSNHVIFQIQRGDTEPMDYCREEPDAGMSDEQMQAWADDLCLRLERRSDPFRPNEKRDVKFTYRIERW